MNDTLIKTFDWKTIPLKNRVINGHKGAKEKLIFAKNNTRHKAGKLE